MRWGIIATGSIANKFAKTVIEMNKAGESQSLIAVASRSIDKAKEFADKYDIIYAFDSYAKICDCDAVDAVYIATPHTMHYENAKMCLEAGKHVLCEKPFTVKSDEARELYEIASKHNVFVLEGFWIKFLPALISMQKIIRSGEIGDVMYARSDYGFVSKGARRVRKLDPSLAGGALLDIGVYNLGFMRMVMGGAKVTGIKEEHRLNEYGTDDFSTMLIKYDNGAVATITTCIGLEIPRHAAIVGTKGSIYLEDFQCATHLRVNINEGCGYEQDFPITMGGFEYEIREVERCVGLGLTTSDILTPEDTIDVLTIMEDTLEKWRA